MKLTNATFLAPLVKMEVNKLTSIVKETLDVELKSKSGITNAQLWQIHRQKKSFGRRNRLSVC